MNVNQPKTLEEFQAILIEGFHQSAIAGDEVYDREAAEIAIKSASTAIFKTLNAMGDVAMVRAVREIAATAPY